MKVVIDTNVLISAIVKGRKPQEVIQFVSERSDIEWILSQEILDEYKEVLSRPKFKITDDVRQEWLTKIDTIPKLIDNFIQFDFSRDTKDAKFIACAISGDADFLITGDKDFDEVKSIGKTVIISVSLFKEIFIDENQG